MSDAVRNKKDQPLKMTKGDHAHTGVRALISAIPIVGSPFEIIFSKYYPSPIDVRRDKLLVSVVEGLDKLKEKYGDLTPEALAKNDLFVTVLLQAVSIAIKNHQQEKFDALRNAVLNTALKIDIEENMQLTFLRYIDSLTPLHLKMLTLLNDPRGYLQKVGRPFPSNVSGFGIEGIIQQGIPELHKNHEAIRTTFSDLYTFNLINTKPDMLGIMMTDSGAYSPRTSDLAREFLRYITVSEFPFSHVGDIIGVGKHV